MIWGNCVSYMCPWVKKNVEEMHKFSTLTSKLLPWVRVRGYVSLSFSSLNLKAQVSALSAWSHVVHPSVSKLSTFSSSSPEPLSNFNQTWYKAFLCGGDSISFKWKAVPFSEGTGVHYEIAKKKTLTINFKKLLLHNNRANFN